jgi:dihydrofolate synthase/folylpolyglutamate synthase
MDVIEAVAARNGAPLLAYGQHWHVSTERDRLIYQDDRGLLDLPLPNLPGPHQVMNAGAAIAALRHLGKDEAACEAAITRAYWPARMEKLTKGALVDLAAPAELWLDGGHNPAAGGALAATLRAQSPRPTHLICGMLNTKDIAGYLRPLAGIAQSLTAVSIPGEAATIPAEDTARFAADVGLPASTAASVQDAITAIRAAHPQARILICGSLYLAGHVMRENGA